LHPELKVPSRIFSATKKSEINLEVKKQRINSSISRTN
jgi:hypothetical protein